MAVTYGFDHVHINGPDVEATAAFYERVFGMRRIRTFEANGITFVHLDAFGVRLTITSRTPKATGRGNACDHFALYVEDLGVAIADLTAKGVQFETERASVGFNEVIFLKAPDGVVVEILSPSTK